MTARIFNDLGQGMLRAWLAVIMKTHFSIDNSHSGIHFSVRHMVIAKVRGSFATWTADLDLDDSDLSRSSVAVTIDAASINTHVADRDKHLRSPDFLDADNFPKLTFKSTRVDKTGDDEYAVHGDLTIRGVARPVVLTTELLGRGKDPWGGQRIGFSAKTTIDRKEWDLKYNMVLETGGLLVGEKIEIEIEIEAVAKAAAA